MIAKNTNINTFVVRTMEGILVAAMLVVQGYPAPALAFANQLETAGRFRHGEFIEVTAMAYSSSSDQTDTSPLVTASGSHVRYGIVAANFLPLGTKILIENREFTVEDRMNERYNNLPIIDIWMPSREAARAFGTRTLLIQIEPPAKNS